MPQPFPSERLDAIVRIVRRFPQGGSLDEITRALKPAPARRTLQRWLALLVGEKRLNQEGGARATRYLIPPAERPPVPAESAVARTPVELTVSSAARKIRTSVRRPLTQRQPVGYNRVFLDGYRPNESFYLPAKTRNRLAAVGTALGAELPAGTHARQVLDRLLIDLSWNSSRLEGNTYSLLETERLLQRGEAAEGKDVREAQMLLNHKRAIELLVDQAEEIGFNRYTLLNLHAMLAENLLADARAGGRLRSIPVGIAGTVFHPPEGPALIEECFDQMLATATAISDPFEQAFFVMVHLPYLQPFEDVNKRVSRLAANIPLVRLNLSPVSFVDVPERDYIEGVLGVYELNRVELLRDVFVWAYERSCARYAAVHQSLGEPDPFRLRHRQRLMDVVGEAVRGGMDKKAATAFVRREAEKLPEANDRKHFAEIAETELTSLHEGNFARYRLRPAEFHAWKKNWR
jgi:hypothetical protein